MKKIFALLLVAIMVVSFAACGSKLEWPDSKVAKLLPVPVSNKGEISSSSNTYLSVDVKKTSLSDFNEYMEACIDKGFTVESEESGNSYTAFNNEGYELNITYYDSDEEMSIRIEAPEVLGDIEWPTTGLGALVPAPNSTLGNISWNNSEDFIAHVGDISIDEYNRYVTSCENKGFNVDFSKEDDYFSAENKDGYNLTLRYLGFNKIEISIDAPDNDEGTSEENTEHESSEMPTASIISSSNKSVTPTFKETMDSYEAFMDEYVEFMQEYSNSDNTLEMLDDYSKFMKKYSEFVSKINGINQKELSVADAAYYLEVTTRVTQKLLSIEY